MHLPKKQTFAAILAGIVLVGYIAFLLVANYISQVELRTSTLNRAIQDLENRAATLSYFTYERINDMKRLASSKELYYFFVNKALGMSMKYGLSANLQDIGASFYSLIEQKKLGSDFIYDRIDFIGVDNNIHIYKTTANAPDVGVAELSKLINTKINEISINHLSYNGIPGIVLSFPYLFKDKYEGQIITWVSINAVYRHLLQVGEEVSGRAFFIGTGDEYLTLGNGDKRRWDISYLPGTLMIPEKKAYHFKIKGEEGTVHEMLALKAPVINTPFYLVAVVPSKELFGQTELWQLFIILAGVSVLVLFSIGALLRIKDQNLVLSVRLDESNKRQEEISLKNKQLEQEVAERKEYETALKASEKKYRELHESMRDGFVSIDKQGNILECNMAFQEMMGLNTEDLKKMSYEELSPEKWHSSESKRSVIDQVLTRGYSDIYEKEYIRKDKTIFIAELRTYQLSDQAGNKIGSWKIVRDISDRKRAEEELTKAKNSAEAANRAKSQFLANMSHELRTPLNHIIGFTELILTKHFGDLNEQQEEYLNDVFNSSRHLLQLINDVLDIAKVEAGKLEMDLSDVNLKTLLEQSLTMIKEKSLTRKIRLTTNIEDIPLTIKSDERKLKQIIYNLLSNAAKFTREGESICLSACCLSKIDSSLIARDGRRIGLLVNDLEREDKDYSKYIEIAVQDTGIGLKEEDVERIFEPFEQVGSPSSQKYKGTGLGLFLCKNLVEFLGGKIWVESQGEGLGSTFRMVIPLKT